MRPGKDATILALALMVPRALEAAEKLKAEHGIDCEVVDVRSLVPLDTQTILGSVARTHRLFTVEENPRLCGWGAEIVSIVADEAFYDLDGPPVRITTPHIPLPAADILEDIALPTVDRIVDRVRRSMQVVSPHERQRHAGRQSARLAPRMIASLIRGAETRIIGNVPCTKIFSPTSRPICGSAANGANPPTAAASTCSIRRPRTRSPRSRARPSRTPRPRSMPRATPSRAGPRSKPRERAEILRKSFELIMRDAERLAKLITIENGKALSDSRGEVAYAAEFFRWYAEEAVRNIGEVSRAPASGARIVVQHKPAGVAVLVTPWNFPAAMATRKIGPALAAGCPVVLKPASDTPLTMLALMPILEEAGVPAGVVNVIPSRSSGKVVSAMLHDPRVRVVSFTGSTEVGRKLLHEAADNVVKPAMELGGNAPFIVFEDADIDAAIEGAMIAKMRNMGEACTSANRFYVHEKVHDEFAKKLTAKMAALKVGNGLDDGVTVGPLVNADAKKKVIELVDDAVGKGAKVLTGGKSPTGPGHFYPPTVLDAVPDGAKMLNEEIFGPVAAIQTFKSEGEVIKRANDTEYGLVAYLYTKDMSRGMRVSEQLDFGMIGLNRGLVSDPAAPFGGMKQSGIGREGAHEGLMEFLETQYISVTW